MEIPVYIKELLKNPIFKDVDIKTLENAISKEFDRDLCEQKPITLKEIMDRCVYRLTSDEREKRINDILPPSDDIRDADVPDDVDSITEAGKYINPKFSPDTGSEKCLTECMNNITKIVDDIKVTTIKNTDEYKKLDKYLSDYYAASALLHNAFYSLYTYYKYKNKRTRINRLKEVIHKMKYTNSTNSVVGKYFIDRMDKLLIEYRSVVDDGYQYYYKNYGRSTAINSDDIIISKKARKKADKILKNRIKEISNQIYLYKDQVRYRITTKDISYGVVNTTIKKYEIEPTEDEAKDYEYTRKKQDGLYDILVTNEIVRTRRVPDGSSNTGMITYGGTMPKLFDDIRNNAKRIGFNFYTVSGDEYTKYFKKLVDNFSKKHDAIITMLENVDIDNITNGVKDGMSQIFCCGEQLEVPDDEVIDYAKDLDNRTYSGTDDSDISTSKYWKEFTKYLNLNALIPIYWRNGIILPNGVKIPLPIIFIHMITIKVGPVIIVIWLTINGLVIVPVVYILQFEPLADASSIWLIMFRGANKKIKDKTGVEILNIPMVGGINVNPELSKILPFKTDDLPTIERMKITNPLYLVYLNKMLLKIKSSMGLP